MLRKTCLIIPSLLFVGCASQRCAPAPQAEAAVALVPEDAAIVASALVFDPPTIPDAALLDLSRAPRQPTAFVGFEDQTTTFYYLQLDNHQGGAQGERGRYDRHEYVARFGSSTR